MMPVRGAAKPGRRGLGGGGLVRGAGGGMHDCSTLITRICSVINRQIQIQILQGLTAGPRQDHGRNARTQNCPEPELLS